MTNSDDGGFKLKKYFDDGSILIVYRNQNEKNLMATGPSALCDLSAFDEYSCNSLYLRSFSLITVHFNSIKDISKIEHIEFECTDGRGKSTIEVHPQEGNFPYEIKSLLLHSQRPIGFPELSCFRQLNSLRFTDSKYDASWLKLIKLKALSIVNLVTPFTDDDKNCLPNLIDLSIVNPKVKNLEILNSMPNIENLTLVGLKKGIDLSALLRLENIKTLRVEGGKSVTDWDFLEKLKSLKHQPFQGVK